MPDEATEAPENMQETPTDAAPPEGSPATPPESTDEGTPDIDYRKRFEDLQPELTKAQQSRSELERTIQAAQAGDREALDALGIPYEDGDDEEFDFEDDPYEALRAEINQLKESHSSEQEQKLQREEDAFIDNKVKELEESSKFDLTDEEFDIVRDRACGDRAPNGEPNVKGAFEAFKKIAEKAGERYLASKNEAAKAPVGSPGEEKIDPNDDDQRRALAARIMEAEEGSD